MRPVQPHDDAGLVAGETRQAGMRGGIDVPGANRIADLEHRLAFDVAGREVAALHRRLHLIRRQLRGGLRRRGIGPAGLRFLPRDQPEPGSVLTSDKAISRNSSHADSPRRASARSAVGPRIMLARARVYIRASQGACQTGSFGSGSDRPETVHPAHVVHAVHARPPWTRMTTPIIASRVTNAASSASDMASYQRNGARSMLPHLWRTTASRRSRTSLGALGGDQQHTTLALHRMARNGCPVNRAAARSNRTKVFPGAPLARQQAVPDSRHQPFDQPQLEGPRLLCLRVHIAAAASDHGFSPRSLSSSGSSGSSRSSAGSGVSASGNDGLISGGSSTSSSRRSDVPVQATAQELPSPGTASPRVNNFLSAFQPRVAATHGPGTCWRSWRSHGKAGPRRGSGRQCRRGNAAGVRRSARRSSRSRGNGRRLCEMCHCDWRRPKHLRARSARCGRRRGRAHHH